MDEPVYNLLISLALIPVVIGLNIWVRQRRRHRINETGEQEFSSLSKTLMSTLGEGLAVVASLVLIIWILGGLARFLFPAIDIQCNTRRISVAYMRIFVGLPGIEPGLHAPEACVLPAYSSPP